MKSVCDMLQLLKRCLNLSDTSVQKVRGSFPAASAACWIFKPCSSVPEMQDNRVCCYYLPDKSNNRLVYEVSDKKSAQDDPNILSI